MHMISDTAVFGKRGSRDKEPELFVHPQVAAAMVGAAVVGGAISSSASKSAANTQAGAANAATASQQAMFDKTVANNAPYNQAGQAATAKLSGLLGIDSGAPSLVDTSSGTPTMNKQLYDSNPQYRQAWDKAYADHVATYGTGYTSSSDSTKIDAYLRSAMPAGSIASPSQSADFGSLTKPFSMSDFQLDPGIQFQTQQGNQALMNSQAAKNGVLSGGALKDLISYNSGMAATGYQSAYDRYMANKQLTLSSLMGVAGLGQNAAANTGNNSATVSNGIAGTITGAGNAQAAGTIGQANALSGAATGAGNAYFLSSLMGNKNADIGGPVTTSANPNGVYLASNA